jgi:hypothetical protein
MQQTKRVANGGIGVGAFLEQALVRLPPLGVE